MSYAALSTVQTIATGQPFLAATLQQANDNDEFLVNPPACSLKESSGQTLTHNTPAALTADEESFDNDSMHSTVTNTSRITIQTAGRYLFVATVFFTSNGTGARIIRLRVDGSTNYDLVAVGASGSSSTVLSYAKPLSLTAGQYVELMALQTSGGDLDAQMTDFSAMFLTR